MRPVYRQLGQFMTPALLVDQVLDSIPLSAEDVVLEPSFGDGAFLVALIDRFLPLYAGTSQERLKMVLQKNIYGVEFDDRLYGRCLQRLEERFGPLPKKHNLHHADFFRAEFPLRPFTRIVGNPPFGGTIDPKLQDSLDRRYGWWGVHKLKKETYSFFIARSLELLAENGILTFVCSDTFLTIKTMTGLRRRLMDQCGIEVKRIDQFSDETTQPTLMLRADLGNPKNAAVIDGRRVERIHMEATGNFSWQIHDSLALLFDGPTLGEFIVGSGGMTTGKNELFVRKLNPDGSFLEPYEFSFYEDPVTAEGELAKARLNQLSATKLTALQAQAAAGVTVRNVRVVPRAKPVSLTFPHPDYRPYNKATSGRVFSPCTHAIYWKDEGDAVLTYKRNGNWYLRGVGGRPYFNREGLSWQLISPRINARYLPPGFILDSGAPCAFLRDGIDADELWLILGWLQTEKATELLKTVINHTRNIQSKDIEKLPYPWWQGPESREKAVDLMQRMVRDAQAGRVFDRKDGEFKMLEELFASVA